MANLKTTFAGLKLKNPVIISSSGLTDTPDKIKQLENAGAAAVVLKSVFEEQIHAQTGTLHGYGSPEADDYLNTYVRSHMLDAHISLLKETKKTLHHSRYSQHQLLQRSGVDQLRRADGAGRRRCFGNQHSRSTDRKELHPRQLRTTSP